MKLYKSFYFNYLILFGCFEATVCHPFEYRIRKVIAHPTEHSKIISATAGNNEVSIWDIETSHRQGALWASSSPPLTNQGSVRQPSYGIIDTGSFTVLLFPYRTQTRQYVVWLPARSIGRPLF